MTHTITITNRGKKSLVSGGFIYRVDRILKNDEISWRCSAVNTCKGRVRTDCTGNVILFSTSHNHDFDFRKAERQVIRSAVKRKAEEDVSTQPVKLIRKEMEKQGEVLFKNLLFFFNFLEL